MVFLKANTQTKTSQSIIHPRGHVPTVPLTGQDRSTTLPHQRAAAAIEAPPPKNKIIWDLKNTWASPMAKPTMLYWIFGFMDVGRGNHLHQRKLKPIS